MICQLVLAFSGSCSGFTMKLGPRVQRFGVQGCRVWWFIALCARERCDEPSSQQAPSIIIATATTIIMLLSSYLLLLLLLLQFLVVMIDSVIIETVLTSTLSIALMIIPTP